MTELTQDIPQNLASHLKLSVIALMIGIAIALPLGITLTRRPRLRYPVLALASVVQTVPSLALLALMVPVLVYTDGLGLGLSSFGFYPALMALTLYSLLPILRNTVTGIEGVDPSVSEAARGIGMSPKQVLWQIQLPLASPMIVAGIRTATVWVVGAATLATPVGQRSLGNYIFAGLQTKNWAMVSLGVGLAAGLAIILDTLIGELERALASRKRKHAVVVATTLGAVVVIGLLAPRLVSNSHAVHGATTHQEDRQGQDLVDRVVVGTKTFTEQYILAELIQRRLARAGVATDRRDSLGSAVIFDALIAGDIDIYVDYSGTIWANYMKRTDIQPSWRVNADVTAWLAQNYGVRNLGSLGFENAYALAMRKKDANGQKLTSITSLARIAPKLDIGGDYEFFGRPEWQALQRSYGLSFKSKTSYDSTLMYDAIRTETVDVIAAFSSDGRIAGYNLIVLDDPHQALPPYEALILLSKRIANDRRIVAALAPLLGQISLQAMQRANLRVDRDDDKDTPRTASEWLDQSITVP